MKNLSKFTLLVLVCILASCGGGSGGGGGASAPTTALAFTPNPLVSNIQEGTSDTLVVQATLLNPSQITAAPYVLVEDSQGVLVPGSVNISAISSTVFSATLHTSGTLPVGHHKGTFNVHLCKDIACKGEYPGSPSALPYDFNVTPLPLSGFTYQPKALTVYQGYEFAYTVDVNVYGSNLPWKATTTASWLKVSNGTGQGAGTFRVVFSTQNLSAGSYSAKVNLRSDDGQSLDFEFSAQILPVQFSIISGVPNFAAINGAAIAPQSVSFELSNNVIKPWTAKSLMPWMIASPLAGTTPASITLQPNPSIGNLASGNYSADLVLSSPGIDNKTITSKLTLTKPELSASATALTFGGSYGRDFSAKSITVSLNTGSKQWPFEITGLPDWLTTTTPNGQLDAVGTSINFVPNMANISIGSKSATVYINSTVNGDAISLPITVNINVDKHKLLSNEWGVGFAKTPGGDVLTRTLKISDNWGKSTAWSASSDASWLTVTANGNTTSKPNIVLTANPATLADNAVSYANITVASAVAGVQPAVVRVALWKTTAGTETQISLSKTYSTVIADKIRPYVYANDNGSTIDVYNAHTAQLVKSISGVGSYLGNMTVSPDGSRLFVLDSALKSMHVIDLNVLSKIETWTLDKAVDTGTQILAVRSNGVDIVFVGDGTAYSNGKSLGSTAIFGLMTAQADGKRVYIQNSGISPASGRAYNVDYSEMSGGALLVSLQASARSLNDSSNGQDLAVSPDGNVLYVASGAPYQCSSATTDTLTLIGSLPGGEAYPNNVEVASDGRIICGIDGVYSEYDFWVHSSTSALLGGYKVADYAKHIVERELVVTPDGMVVAVLTNNPSIAFVPIGR